MFRGRMIIVFIMMLFFTCYADNNNIKKSHKSVILTIKGVNALTQTQLTGSTRWKLINESTNKVISLTGENSGTTITVSDKSGDISNGVWLISGVSESFIGAALLEIKGLKDQLVEVNMLPEDMKIKIIAQTEATASTVIPISWTAPETIKGKINLQKIGDTPNFYAPPKIFTRGNKERKTKVRLPSEAGEYVFRFYNTEDTKKVITEQKIMLKMAKIEIIAPITGIAGTEIDVSWSAPKTAVGQINLKKPEDKPRFNAKIFIRTRGKQKGTLVLPSDAGEYVLRWFNVFDRRLMLERPIKVIKNIVKLNAPDVVEPNTEIKISWEAAKRTRARIVLSKNEIDNVKNNLATVSIRNNNSAFLKLPNESGDYTINWVSEGDGLIVLKHDIVVGWASRELLAPDKKSFDVD